MVLAWLANACVLVFLVFAGVYLGRAHRIKKARRGSRELVVSPLAGLALGAMLLGLQEIVQPQVWHMIVEMQEEKSVDDENGEPLGGREFHEQMRRIREGGEVDEVTVRLDSADPGAPR